MIFSKPLDSKQLRLFDLLKEQSRNAAVDSEIQEQNATGEEPYCGLVVINDLPVQVHDCVRKDCGCGCEFLGCVFPMYQMCYYRTETTSSTFLMTFVVVVC